MIKSRTTVIAVLAVAMMALVAAPASASHSWGNYHWGRTTSPFTVKFGDNVTSQWDFYLDQGVADWNKSSVVKMAKVLGTVTNPKRCAARSGRVEVCNASYGSTGWLGIAGISLSGGHIVSGYTKLNDTYFNTASYNKPAWRALVTCQEIAHNVGLGHQDENFSNANLGSCMDYTNLPDSNQHPNQHDFDQLVTIYGSHLDTTNTSSATPASSSPASSAITTVDGNRNGNVIHVFWVPGGGKNTAA